jgi:hypothetical protein
VRRILRVLILHIFLIIYTVYIVDGEIRVREQNTVNWYFPYIHVTYIIYKTAFTWISATILVCRSEKSIQIGQDPNHNWMCFRIPIWRPRKPHLCQRHARRRWCPRRSSTQQNIHLLFPLKFYEKRLRRHLRGPKIGIIFTAWRWKHRNNNRFRMPAPIFSQGFFSLLLQPNA